MKLEIARALFLVAGLAVTTAAVAAWEEPRPTVFSKAEMADQCALPREAKPQQQAQVATMRPAQPRLPQRSNRPLSPVQGVRVHVS